MVQFELRLAFAEDLCTACNCCVLACSFKRGKRFSPQESAIQILRDLENNSVECRISEHCDLCPNLEVPVCIASCWPGALQLTRKVTAQSAYNVAGS